ncbi:hypothetical protein [Candidatus Viridilinea mediisalina]|uniref:hypothetical protein n=1 Tax=Candidatus Viridilinea mediisalina TaxID=2024553 RepID=UPI0013FD7B90|nr:hypothetical protein [Candidatus Viridilinea mediisalina]
MTSDEQQRIGTPCPAIYNLQSTIYNLQSTIYNLQSTMALLNHTVATNGPAPGQRQRE